MHVTTPALPLSIRSVLSSVGFHKADIKLETKDRVSPQYWANEGSRGYFALVNLATGEKKETHGSWGGPNMFTNPAVDGCDKEMEIPDGFIAIKGSIGNQVFLTLYGNQNTVTPMLPKSEVQLTPNEELVLQCHVQLKGGKYRDEAYERACISNVDQCKKSLEEKGLLKISKNGASRVTTAGRNACSKLEKVFL